MARTKQRTTQYDVLQYLIAHGPGRSALELSCAIHGDGATQQRVSQAARYW